MFVPEALSTGELGIVEVDMTMPKSGDEDMTFMT